MLINDKDQIDFRVSIVRVQYANGDLKEVVIVMKQRNTK